MPKISRVQEAYDDWTAAVAKPSRSGGKAGQRWCFFNVRLNGSGRCGWASPQPRSVQTKTGAAVPVGAAPVVGFSAFIPHHSDVFLALAEIPFSGLLRGGRGGCGGRLSLRLRSGLGLGLGRGRGARARGGRGCGRGICRFAHNQFIFGSVLGGPKKAALSEAFPSA